MNDPIIIQDDERREFDDILVRIVFAPTCSKCSEILYDAPISYDKFTNTVTPRMCPKCKSNFSGIVIPGNFPVILSKDER